MSLIVAVTEYAASADSDGPQQLTLHNAITALENEGVDSTPGHLIAQHPLLSISGTVLHVGDASIEVYVYQQVADRVTDEQRIQHHILQLSAITTMEDAPLRVTSARNLLFLYHVNSDQTTHAIQAAARSLTTAAER